MLLGLLIGAGCTTNEPPPAVLGSVPLVAADEACAPAIRAAEARWAAEAGDALAELDTAVRTAAEIRGEPRGAPPALDVLADQVADLHARVDRDFDRLHAARQEWEAARRALAADAVALDEAIDRFERPPESR